MLEAILQCPQPHSWIELATRKYSASIEILDSKILPNNVVQHLFEVQTRPELTDELLAAIRRDEDVIELEAMKSKTGRVYGSVSSQRCTVCMEVAKSKCFLVSVTIRSGEAAQWMIFGNNESFKELVATLETDKIPFEVKLRKNLEDDELLTSRQEQVISVAFDRGYFDFPKKIGLRELAIQSGIKTSTLAEILRRGQRKIVGEYLAKRAFLGQNRRST